MTNEKFAHLSQFGYADDGRYLIASASSEPNVKMQTIVIWTSVRPIVPRYPDALTAA